MKNMILKFAVLIMMIGTFSAAHAKTPDRDLQKEEANRKLVLDFINTNDVDTAMTYISDKYKQHNPTVADGKDGVTAFFRDLRTRYPKLNARVVHIAADGDLVWVHAHLTRFPEDPGFALVDIFRVENGKFVEHWDVMQPVPENTTNSNSMF